MILVGKNGRLLPLLYVALFAVVAIRSAWVTEDAYITFRTVDNFVNGYGLTWNTVERVQAYTHPLWMFLMSGAYRVTGDVYYTSILLNLALSLAALLLLTFRIARSLGAAVLAVTVLIFSKAFVDYSTSGLENPLTHVLLAAFTLVYLRREAVARSFLLLCLLAALLVLNRMDTGLLVLPALVFVFVKTPRWEAIRAGLIGFSPMFLWFLFSLFYYGFPFPNTAYAKLNTGLPSIDLMRQGFYYLVNSVRTDPITLAAVAGGIAVAFLKKRWTAVPLAAGILLSLIYVVRVGGDFMSGRFLTGALFCSVLLLARYRPRSEKAWVAATICAVGIGFLAPHSTVLAGRAYGEGFDDLTDAHGVTDERGWYFSHAGLFNAQGHRVEDHLFAQRALGARDSGPVVVREGNIGYSGFHVGPEAYLVNEFALSDPLLARLPVRGPSWRIGHFVRDLPEGYIETLASGENRLRDWKVARYYDRLSLVVRGDLLDPERLKEIWRLNTGAHDHLLQDRFDACREHLGAFTLAARNDWKPAGEALRRSVALDSTRSAAWYLLSFAHRAGRDLGSAHHAIGRALHLRPGDKKVREAHLKIGDLYLEAGQAARALQVYGEAARYAPTDVVVCVRLGTALGKLERWEESSQVLEAAVALDSTRTGVWVELAEARRLAGDLRGARDAALRAIERDPSDVRFWREYLTIGSTYHNRGHVDSALAIYEAVSEASLELTDVHVNTGILRFGQGRYEASASAFRKAVALSPDDAGGHLGLAEALERLGRAEEAAESYRKGLSIEPDNEAARAGLKGLTELQESK